MRSVSLIHLSQRALQRLAQAAAFGALVVLGTAAFAQSQPDNVDPPGRVGRVSYVSGPVQLVDLASGEAEPATLNWPITSGLRLSTGRTGRAEVYIGSLAVRLDDETELDFARVDDEAIQLVVSRGSVALNVRNPEMLRELDLLTPRERVVIEEVGHYRIDVDRPPGTTRVTAFAGQARILSGRMIFTVASGQSGEVDAAPVTSFRLGAPAPDYFDDWVAARERFDEAPRATQYVSPEMTGVEVLDHYGDWRAVDSYGPVWFPNYVPVGWAPYRFGHWEYIEPWGWTWVDDAPWGFAPFHYGRWVLIGTTWGWVPGTFVPRPVYAPALVAWVGRAGVSVSIAINSAVGWFPLAPGEIYIPDYRCSRRYVNVINVTQVTNVANITVIQPPPRYVNRDADRATWVAGSALFRRGPIQRALVPPPANWRDEHVGPRPPIEAPREIKKRPTPIPIPSRPIEDRFRPPRQATPSFEPPERAPSAPVVPAPRQGEVRRLPPREQPPGARVERPQPPARVTPPSAIAPEQRRAPAAPAASPSETVKRPAPMPIAPGAVPPSTPHVAPPTPPRVTMPPAGPPAEFSRRPAPAPRVPVERPAPGAAANGHDRAPPSVAPAPQASPPGRASNAPPAVHAPRGNGPARADEPTKGDQRRTLPERPSERSSR